MASRKRLTPPHWLRWLPAPAYVVGVVVVVLVALLALVVGLGFLLALLRYLDIGILGTLSGHAPRTMAWILAGWYAVALACGIARTSVVRPAWVRWALLVPVALGFAMFLGLMPGRYFDHGAADRQVAAAFGNAAPFAEIVIWVTLAAAFVGLGVLVLAALVSRSWMPVLVGWAALAGATGLVVHLNAPGSLGDAPQPITSYLAGRVHAGDDFEVQGRPGPRLWLTRVAEVGCTAALARLDAPARLPSCRDALLLSGTGQSGRIRSGRVDCVLLAPAIGHRAGEWQDLLQGSRLRGEPPAADIHVSGALADDAWLTCAEDQGRLPPVPSRGPLIRTAARLVISVEVGLL